MNIARSIGATIGLSGMTGLTYFGYVDGVHECIVVLTILAIISLMLSAFLYMDSAIKSGVQSRRSRHYVDYCFRIPLTFIIIFLGDNFVGVMMAVAMLNTEIYHRRIESILAREGDNNERY